MAVCLKIKAVARRCDIASWRHLPVIPTPGFTATIQEVGKGSSELRSSLVAYGQTQTRTH
jgi:hypothetical protein